MEISTVGTMSMCVLKYYSTKEFQGFATSNHSTCCTVGGPIFTINMVFLSKELFINFILGVYYTSITCYYTSSNSQCKNNRTSCLKAGTQVAETLI